MLIKSYSMTKSMSMSQSRPGQACIRLKLVTSNQQQPTTCFECASGLHVLYAPVTGRGTTASLIATL